MLQQTTLIPFKYRLTGISEPPFTPPVTENEHDRSIFSMAENFGITIILAYEVNITSTGGSINQPGMTTLIKKSENGGPVIVPLGIQIEIPSKIAFYHRGLHPKSLDYVVDRTMKDWYNVNLYLKVEQADNYVLNEGTPVLKIMPLIDTHYQFNYKRAF